MSKSPKASVAIIDYTGAGNPDKLYAARLLAYTKNTRLQMTPDGFSAFMSKPEAEILTEIAYMANTIPSSWEFADVTFAINNVSRACAQQITRTRTASFAMQSQRVTDMSSVTYHVPESTISENFYKRVIEDHIEGYEKMVVAGESLEDARGVLPINVHCNLVAKYNLRSLVELLRARDSLRVQGEYRDVARQMKAAVLDIWPWSEPFFKPQNLKAIELIEEVANKLSGEHRTQLAKAADLLKKG